MNKKSTTKKSTVKKTNRKKMPVKKPTKHSTKRSSQAKTVKMVQIPELSIKDGYSAGNVFQMLCQTIETPKPVVKQRNFWDLFSNVKNHNWQLMMQKDNYLDEFVKLVEEMPEEQFRVLFIEPKEDKPIRITQKFDCGCGEPCLCEKTRTVRTINKYSEYLKAGRLERYDIEIQHLRYLINLQNNGKPVPPSYDSTDFFKRSNAPKKNEVQTTSVSVAKVLEKVREANNSMHEWKAQTNDPITTNSLSNKLDEWGQKYSSKEPVVKRFEESDTRPGLRALSETAKTNKVEEELWNKFVKDHELYMSDNVDDVLKIAPSENQSTSAPVSSIPTLPEFWQELDSARKQIDAFDTFYAKKQVELILAIRVMRAEKKRLLNTTYEPGYITSLEEKVNLEEKVKKYLKAKKEFAVVKKVLKLAYKEFDKNQPTQANPESLKAEMAKYTASPSVNDLSRIFDHMSPTPEVYKRVMSERSQTMRSKGWVNPEKNFSGLHPSTYTPLTSPHNGKFRHEKDIPTVVVESSPEINALEDALFEHPQVKQKVADLTKKCEETNVGSDLRITGTDSIKESEDVSRLLQARFKLQEDVKAKEKMESSIGTGRLEKIADEIQNMVLKSWVDPEKDFPDLIKNGLDSEGVEKWKEKYQNKPNPNADLIKEFKEEVVDLWQPVTTKPEKVEEAIQKIKQRARIG